MKRTLYLCSCGSMQHLFVVSADRDDIFIEVHLSPLPFLSRLKNAIQYVFGKRSDYGDFEEIILTPEMALDLGDKLVECSSGKNVAFAPNDVF